VTLRHCRRKGGQGRDWRENDEGRESARGIEAAWTENGVILPAYVWLTNRAG